VHYKQHSYIVREGEPLDAMLFITQGIIWNFTTSNAGRRSAKCIEKGSFYGEELLEWGLDSPAAYPTYPTSQYLSKLRKRIQKLKPLL
jgi:cyclic nucleotide gated channel